MKKTGPATIIGALGVGLLPGAPGTWGTLVAVAAFAVVRLLTPGEVPVLALIIAATVLGLLLARRVEDELGRRDPGAFVLDEAAGYWVAVLGFGGFAGFGGDVAWGWIAAGAFVLFRIFDILKPPPVRQCDRIPGAFGVMLDDLVAGALANLVLRIVLLGVGALAG